MSQTLLSQNPQQLLRQRHLALQAFKDPPPSTSFQQGDAAFLLIPHLLVLPLASQPLIHESLTSGFP